MSNLDMDVTQCSNCSIRVIVLFLIVLPNSIYLMDMLGLWNVLNLCNETNRDAYKIKGSMGCDYKTEAMIQL